MRKINASTYPIKIEKGGFAIFYTGKNFSFFASQFGAYLNSLQFKERHFLYRGDMRNGRICCSHLSVPWFGPFPGSLSKAPRHGWLRETLCENPEVLSQGISMSFDCSSGVHPGSSPLRGRVSYLVGQENSFSANIELSLLRANYSSAPINPAQHFYWINPNGIRIETTGYTKFIKNKAVPEPIMFPYIDPVTLTIIDVGTVVMRLKADKLKDPQVVIWSDGEDYTCVELVAGHPDSYQKKNGLWVRDSFKPFTASFIFDFFLEE